MIYLNARTSARHHGVENVEARNSAGVVEAKETVFSRSACEVAVADASLDDRSYDVRLVVERHSRDLIQNCAIGPNDADAGRQPTEHGRIESERDAWVPGSEKRVALQT